MARVKGALATRKRRNKVLKLAKGYFGAKSKLFKTAKEAVMKSGNYAYIGRRLKKRDFRRLWITRISAACKMNGMNYSTFMNGLNKAGVQINRKMLADIAVNDEAGFTKLADTAKKAETAVKTAKTAKALASWKIWLIVGVIVLILILFIVLLSAISGDLGGLTGLNGYSYIENNYFNQNIVLVDKDDNIASQNLLTTQPVQQVAIDKLSSISRETQRIIDAHDAESGLITWIVNGWYETLGNEKYSKSYVEQQLKAFNADIKYITEASQGKMVDYHILTNSLDFTTFEEAFRERRGVKFNEKDILEHNIWLLITRYGINKDRAISVINGSTTLEKAISAQKKTDRKNTN